MSEDLQQEQIIQRWLASVGATSSGAISLPKIPAELPREWADIPTQLGGRSLEHAVVSALLARLRSALRQPALVIQNDERAFIEHHLGCEWAIDWAAKQCTVRSLNAEPSKATPGSIGLKFVLPSSSFLERWLASEIGNQIPHRVRYFLIERLWRRIVASTELRAARRELASLRRRMSGHFELVMRLWGDADPTTHDLFFLADKVGLIEQRLRENPKLLPVLGSVPKHIDKVWHGDYSALRDYLKGKGLTDGGWRLLCRHGRKLWKGAVGTARFEEMPMLTVCAIANAVAACGGKRIPPAPVVRAIIDADGMVPAGREITGLVPHTLLLYAMRRWDSLASKPERLAFARSELCVVIDWWQRSEISIVDLPRRPNWLTLLKRARAWHREMTAKHENEGAAWLPELPELAIGELRCVPLRSSIDLWQEAIQMRNCLDDETYRSQCKSGDYCLVSIRSPDRRRPLATFEMRNTVSSYSISEKAPAFWAIGEFRLSVNRQPSERERKVACEYEQQVNAMIACVWEQAVGPKALVKGHRRTLSVNVIDDDGWLLAFEMRVQSESVTVRLSHALDRIRPIFAWLEAIAAGVHQCSFQTHGENSEAYFEYRARGRDIGVISIYTEDGTSFGAVLPDVEIVSVIYQAIRGRLLAVASSLEQAPGGTYWNRLESCLIHRPSRSRIVHRLGSWPRVQVVSLLARLRSLRVDDDAAASVIRSMLTGEANGDALDADPAGEVLSHEFDHWPVTYRMECVEGALERSVGRRESAVWERSVALERWLDANGTSTPECVARPIQARAAALLSHHETTAMDNASSDQETRMP